MVSKKILFKYFALLFVFSFAPNLVQAKSKANDLFVFKNFKDERSVKYKFQSVVNDAEPLVIVFISDANLYPALIKDTSAFPNDMDSEELGYIQKPQTSLDLIEQSVFTQRYKIPSISLQSQILYEESQVLLQETIREIFQLLKYNKVDLVVFGGNQVYSNEYFDLLEDIVYELHKYSIPYSFILGPNELRGPNKAEKLIKHRYYLQEFKDTSIIVVDNLSQEIVPKYLPEEANEQYLWFKKTLTKLSEKQTEVYIFSYKPLEQRVLDFIDTYPDLKLRLIAHSSKYNYSLTEPIVSKFNTKPTSKSLILSNSSISVYPLSYTIIEKNARGEIWVNNKTINLEGLRKVAKGKTRYEK